MRRFPHALALAAAVIGLLMFLLAAGAEHATRPHTPNLQALGHSPHPAAFLPTPSAERNVNSDLAFWGDLDLRRELRRVPHHQELGRAIRRRSTGRHCNGNQGDIVVWGDILLRAWNSRAGNRDLPENRFCDGQPVPVGFEGVHVLDISDLEEPGAGRRGGAERAAGGDAPGCGSHTLTAVPDLENGRVLVYNLTSGGNAALPPALRSDWLDTIQVPLDNPGDAAGSTTSRSRADTRAPTRA